MTLTLSPDEAAVVTLLRQLPTQAAFAWHCALAHMVTGQPVPDAPIAAQRAALRSCDFDAWLSAVVRDLARGQDGARGYRVLFRVPRPPHHARAPYRKAAAIAQPKVPQSRARWEREFGRE
jgi:hypothetical protein